MLALSAKITVSIVLALLLLLLLAQWDQLQCNCLGKERGEKWEIGERERGREGEREEG